MTLNPELMILSTTKTNAAKIIDVIITTVVDSLNSSLLGQVTFFISLPMSAKKFIILSFNV